MERGFYNEDIEELLKQKADQYRMYPSDKVWKGIQRSLHPSRKWYWLGFMLFLTAIGYYAFVELFVPRTSKPVSQNNASSSSPIPQPANDQTTAKAVIVPFGNSQKENSNTGNQMSRRSFVLNPVPFTNEPINTAAAIPAGNNTLAFADETPVFDITTRRIIHDIRALPENNLTLIISQEDNEQVTDANTSKEVSKAAVDQAIEALVPAMATPASGNLLNEKTGEQEDGQRINWLHEMAVYELQAQKPKRLSWQLAFTPTMNYRKLTSNSRYTTQSDAKNLPIAMQVKGNPDELVNHKPALGFEFGSHMMYAANKTFTLRAGLQFNYSRYDIQAYTTESTEKATIALNSSTGLPAGALTSYTNIGNFGGESVENLRNQYFQLSMPVGLEVNLLGNGKLQVGMAGTLQPTYLMNRNTYLITTDYKNYTKEPSLVRRVNLHTSAEAFVAYKTGDLKWQVGPQFRYQLFSSYIREYPIREQLMEFGIKIGVAKTIR